MNRSIRIFENSRGKADNIGVVDFKLTLLVHNIDESTSEVLFVANPSIEDYGSTQNSQSIEIKGTDETRLLKLSPTTGPISIEANGTTYRVAIDSIGTEQKGRKWAYCDFAVSW